MKIKIFCLIAVLGALFAVIGATTTRDHVVAASCTDGNGHFSVNYTSGALYSPYTEFKQVGGDGPKDTGVTWACKGSPRAIMFFADYDEPYTHLGGNKYRFNVNVAVDPMDDNFEIALIGLTHGTPGNAVDMRLCTDGPSCNTHDSDVFKTNLVGKVLPRGSTVSSSLSGWTTPSSDKIKVTIDGPELYRKVLSKEVHAEYEESGGYYKVHVYNYRCFNSLGPGDHCGPSTMYLTMKADQKAQFEGVSTVNKTEITSTDGTYDVTFTHTVTRTNSGGFTLHNSCNTNATATGAIYSVNKKGVSKDCDFNSFNVGDNKVTTDRVQGTIYPGQTITLCESVTYNDFVHSIETSLTTTTTSAPACVTITRPQALCAADSDFVYTYKGGTNLGRIGIANLAQGSTVKYSPTTGYSASNRTQFAPDVYAKPGDSIRFTYDMCAGAELANSLNISPKKNITYKPSSASTTGNGGNYLFGNSLQTWTNSATSGFLSSGIYEHTTTSPSGTNDYACAVYNQSTNNFKSNSYQIPGLVQMPATEDNCKSAKKVAKSSDVGSIFSQSLEWTNLTITNRTQTSGTGTYTATARVVVPYNYKLKLALTEPTSVRNVTAGMDVSIKFKLDVLARKNSLVQNDAYKTHTKNTSYRIFQWYESADTTADQIKAKLGTATDNGYYSNRDFSVGKTILASASNQTIDSKIDSIAGTFSIPSNISIGTKVCFAGSVYPADSHNNPGLEDAGTIDQGVALQNSGTGYYISEPTCYTVGKKPNLIVKGGFGLYAYNGVESATTSRKLNNGASYYFGSWSEYAIISGGDVKGIGSGASRWGGTLASNVSGNRTCFFSTMSIANEDCSTSNNVGNVSLSDDTSSSPTVLRDQIMTRYISSVTSAGTSVRDFKGQTVDLAGICTYDPFTKQYKGVAGAKYDCLSNGTQYIYSSGDLTISGGSALKNYCMSPAQSNYDSRTRVIHVEGTLYIDANFYYGDQVGNGCTYNTEVYTATTRLPQSIIIADKVVFKERITNHDGWIIADEVVTCDVSPTSKEGGINVNRCNRQLRINGPVITRKLQLLRTRGSGSNSSSGNTYDGYNGVKSVLAEPAEVFSIGPETYLWSYQQAARYSQAYTTYQRELPPRY